MSPATPINSGCLAWSRYAVKVGLTWGDFVAGHEMLAGPDGPQWLAAGFPAILEHVKIMQHTIPQQSKGKI